MSKTESRKYLQKPKDKCGGYSHEIKKSNPIQKFHYFSFFAEYSKKEMIWY